MNTYGWEQLDCKFFAATCRRVLDAYLEEIGFQESHQTAGGGVVYKNSDVFIEISYDTNLFPNYVLHCVTGIGDGAYNSVGAFNGIPMWYIIPQGHPYRTKLHWTFRNEEDLTRILPEMKNEFLETTIKPLLLNRDVLERIIKNFQSEFC